MKFIIDGYNVIHQIATLKNKRLRSQREQLIKLLETAQVKSRRFKDLTVVFDGQLSVSAARVYSTVKVIFSKGKRADKKIKEMLECSNGTRDICVVSDDREVKFYISSLGAKKLAVKEFLKMISSTFIEHKSHSFKLEGSEARKITQELEQIWLERKEK